MTLRASADLKRPADGDSEATWLLGHTQRLTFQRLWRHAGDLFVRAVLHVPCKYLASGPKGDHCTAHGFVGPVAAHPRRPAQPRQLGGGRFRVVHQGRMADLTLARPLRSARALTVLQRNPCQRAPCRTADNTMGAACCRDLQIEIMCDRAWTRHELLIRARKSPYLCKVVRERDESLEAELISACAYLGEDGVACTLHGRKRPDGREAKPDLCRRWPHPTRDETLHRGCVFAVD